MTPVIQVEKIGAAVTVQDAGWSGTLAQGLSRGGAADTFALSSIWALLGEKNTAALEMAGFGGTFRFLSDARIAIAGAVMAVRLDGTALLHNAVHFVQAGQVLEIGAARVGLYGYLGIGGGFLTPKFQGSASTHRGAGLGQVIEVGQTLKMGADLRPDRIGLALPSRPKSSAPIRVVATAHTELFSEKVRTRFEETVFTRGSKGNRQGIALEGSEDFALQGGQSILSETVIPGDIQVPGQGALFALLADSQTTGGYPRIAAVLPCDLPRIAQAVAGDELKFKFVTREEGIAAERADHKARATLGKRCEAILRDPAQINDLLSYQLISGAVSGESE
ncbi:biotin-dependent carboxyltransferase family protein [Planktotalea sp.]|uniref:5-oxoprolinase subunit C family protein n=1 Tax=Planktotalea sp. TaxID=2029877 RepID=UPI0035C7E542